MVFEINAALAKMVHLKHQTRRDETLPIVVRECQFFNILAESNFTVFLYNIKAKEVTKLLRKS